MYLPICNVVKIVNSMLCCINIILILLVKIKIIRYIIMIVNFKVNRILQILVNNKF